ADGRRDQARLWLGRRLAERSEGDRLGRAGLGVDGVRLGRGPALQLHRRYAEHVSDLERDAARRAGRLRARLLRRLRNRSRLVHRRVLQQPRLVDHQRLGVEVPTSGQVGTGETMFPPSTPFFAEAWTPAAPTLP